MEIMTALSHMIRTITIVCVCGWACVLMSQTVRGIDRIADVLEKWDRMRER